MYATPLDEKKVAVIDDSDPQHWRIEIVNFDSWDRREYRTEYFDEVKCFTANTSSGALWALTMGGQLVAISSELEQAAELPVPFSDAAPYNVFYDSNRYFLTGGKGNIWWLDIDKREWKRISGLPSDALPKGPQRSEATGDFLARALPIMQQQLTEFPDIYRTVKVADNYYFVGALGFIAEFDESTLKTVRADNGLKIVAGHEENGAAVLGCTGTSAEILIGTVGDGFEAIFRHDDPVFHLTAYHENSRYIGAGLDPDYKGPCLFTLDDDELNPVLTKCRWEPGPLLRLETIGQSLWAVDLDGIYRLAKGEWTYLEITS